MRSLGRLILERALGTGGGAALLGRRMRGRRLVLAYHNILPDSAAAVGDSSLHLRRKDFSAQLDLLQRHAQVVPLPEILEGVPGSELPQVAITFDDAYAGALTAGVAELRARGMPATVFVTPGMLGGRDFWWDVLAKGPGLDPELRRQALDECGGQDSVVRRWAEAAGFGLREVPPWARTATEADLDQAMDYHGLLLGCHTWTHPNLTRLADAELEWELLQPLKWLQARYGPRAGPWIAYPYGISDARVERAAGETGHSAGFRVLGGWIGAADTNRYTLPRFNVSAGLSPEGFRLRLSGLFCR